MLRQRATIDLTVQSMARASRELAEAHHQPNYLTEEQCRRALFVLSHLGFAVHANGGAT